MARKRTKESTGEAARETASSGSGAGMFVAVRRQLYRPITLLTAAAVVALAFGWPVIRKHFPDLESRSEYQLPADAIQITQPPHWVPHNLVEQVVEQANLPPRLSLLDDDLTREVAEAFALNPWVDEVISVTKSFPASIHVKLSYRRPVAMVQLRKGMYPVDAGGVLLPPRDFSTAEAKLYPKITDVLSTPQGPAGSNWGDPVVTEAAQLAADLAPHWKKLHLASIVCPRASSPSDALDEGVYTLVSTGGSEIIWGHGPGSDHPGELSTAQKIERLQKYAAKFGGLDAPQGRFRIDIRHWRDITRTPLSAEIDGTGQLNR